MSEDISQLAETLRRYWLDDMGLRSAGVPPVTPKKPPTVKDFFDDLLSGAAGDEQPANEVLYVLQLARAEASEGLGGVFFGSPVPGWAYTTGTSLVFGTTRVEGETSVEVVGSSGTSSTANPHYGFQTAVDFTAEGRFTDDDYVVFALYLETAPLSGNIQVYFFTTNVDVFRAQVSATAGWQFIAVKRSDFVVDLGSPSWASIIVFAVTVTMSGGGLKIIRVDNVQIIKADPDNTAVPNATGRRWDFDGGEWTVLQDVPGVRFALAQLKTAASVRYTAQRMGVGYQEYNVSRDVTGGVLVREDGKLGLWWGEDPDNCYEVRLDTAANQVKLLEYANGSVTTTHGTRSFTADPNVKYYLGLRRDGEVLKAFCTANPADMFTPAALQIAVADVEYTGGQVGFSCEGIQARYMDLQAGSPEFALTAGWAADAGRLGGLTGADYEASALLGV